MPITNSFRVSAVVVAVVAASLLTIVISHNPASALSTTAVAGTTITVNTEEDESNTDGDCSLREAIEAADTNDAVDGCDAGSATERDAIHFALGKVATIVLDSELPTITDTMGLIINGQRAKITVSGDDSVRVFFVDSGKLTLANLKVADGFATDPQPDGAGLFNLGGTVKVKNSTFSGNTVEGIDQGPSAGGGIHNLLGTLTVLNSTFSGNSAEGAGGGIFNNANGTLTVLNSTFSGNSAEQGGVIFDVSDDTLTVTSSTFSGNSAAPGEAAAIVSNFGIATVKNTIVANSTQGDNCEGAITDGGYNIEDGTSCGFSEANNSMPSTEPKLAASLADNGGPTNTIKLRKGSPAINAIPKATNGCGTEVKTDQRGVKRPQGKKCDISAFEKKMVRR